MRYRLHRCRKSLGCRRSPVCRRRRPAWWVSLTCAAPSSRSQVSAPFWDAQMGPQPMLPVLLSSTAHRRSH